MECKLFRIVHIYTTPVTFHLLKSKKKLMYVYIPVLAYIHALYMYILR